jgi:hypothetical protein
MNLQNDATGTSLFPVKVLNGKISCMYCRRFFPVRSHRPHQRLCKKNPLRIDLNQSKHSRTQPSSEPCDKSNVSSHPHGSYIIIFVFTFHFSFEFLIQNQDSYELMSTDQLECNLFESNVSMFDENFHVTKYLTVCQIPISLFTSFFQDLSMLMLADSLDECNPDDDIGDVDLSTKQHLWNAWETLRTLVPIDVSKLHECPYKTKQDKLMAILSIEAKLHGRNLDRVFNLISMLDDTTCDIRVAKSTRQLHAIEQTSLHQGLQFGTETIMLDFQSSFPDSIKRRLSSVSACLRKDMSIVIAELISRPCTFPHLKWQYEEQRDSNGERVYSGFFSGDCWKDFESSVTIGTSVKKLAGLLLFSDSTNLLRFGNKSIHPIYVCPAGLNYEHMGVQTMTLLGFVPEVPGEIRSFLNTQQKKEFARWSRFMLARVYKVIVDKVHSHTYQGIPLYMKQGIEVIHPFVVTLISDHLEGNQVAQLDNLDCRYCVLDKSVYSQTDFPGSTRACTATETTCEIVLCPTHCGNVNPFDILCTAHCIFHDVDEGIWKWIVKEMLIPSFQHHSDQLLLSTLITHLSNVPGFVKVLTVTTTSTASLTAHCMRQLLVQLLANLAAWVLLDGRRDSLFLVVLSLCKWYSLVLARAVKESDLATITSLAIQLRMHLRNGFREVASRGSEERDYDTEAVKHHIILHFEMLIRRYGALLYQSCEHWDSAHKFMIKDHVRTVATSDCTNTIIKRVFFERRWHFYVTNIAICFKIVCYVVFFCRKYVAHIRKTCFTIPYAQRQQKRDREALPVAHWIDLKPRCCL